jgi:predicted RecB family nuclease
MHISYSELKTWAECSWRHKLEYLEKLKMFKGNEYTSFGKALHSVGEKFVFENTDNESPEDYFELQFLNELRELKFKDKELSLNQNLIFDMRKQGTSLSTKIVPALEDYFDTYEIFSVEEKLYEDIDNSDLKFKGFIDLVVKKNNTYYIIDWKTCSWGWGADKKKDRLLNYQLVLYKHYFAKKHNIDSKNIKTCFGLLKRTAKKNQVEIFEITSGPKKTENALNLINNALYNINNKRFIKNKLSCQYCPFNNNIELCKK